MPNARVPATAIALPIDRRALFRDAWARARLDPSRPFGEHLRDAWQSARRAAVRTALRAALGSFIGTPLGQSALNAAEKKAARRMGERQLPQGTEHRHARYSGAHEARRPP